jgi:hypothetical protein
MGYFSNGTEEMMYADKYCDKCKHDIDSDCPIRLMHMLYNYDECNKKDSILHKMIPRSKDGLGNEKCVCFKEVVEVDDRGPLLPPKGK